MLSGFWAPPTSRWLPDISCNSLIRVLGKSEPSTVTVIFAHQTANPLKTVAATFAATVYGHAAPQLLIRADNGSMSRGSLGQNVEEAKIKITTAKFHCLMPGFHHSVAVLPFRSYRCRCGWERWKCLSVYIGMKWPERWLVVHLRQNGKNRIRSYCYIATERRLRHNGRWKRERRNGIFHVSNVILTALT